MKPVHVDEAALGRLLSMTSAVDALDRAFGEQLPETPTRSHQDVGGGDLLIMPSWSEDFVGVKLVTVTPDNPGRNLPLIHGSYVLFEKPSLAPIATFDAAPLTALRTAAVSGVATRYLAREGSRHLVVFGAGAQARAHLVSMAAVASVEEVTVVSRSAERAEALVELARSQGLRARTGSPESVARADIVCTCTTSVSPVLDGNHLNAGTHVNAVGTYKPDHRELDDETLRRAGRVVVDVDAAVQESGDLVIPLRDGTIGREQILPLQEVVANAGGRTSEEDVTVFKSVGAAFEDLIVAAAAATRL